MLNLPLRDIDWDIFLKPGEAGTTDSFPPARFWERDERLAVLGSIYQADYTDFVDDNDRVEIPVNFPRFIIWDYVSTLMGSPPVVQPPAAPDTSTERDALTSAVGAVPDPQEPRENPFDDFDLMNPAEDALTDMLRYGGALLWAGQTEGGPFVSAVAPTRWYPASDGGAVLVSPYVSDEAGSAIYDRAEVVEIDPDGATTVGDAEYKPRFLGSVTGRREIGLTQLYVSPMEPKVGMWGTAMLQDMAPLVVEEAKRFTKNSQLLDNPGAVFWKGSEDDFKARFPSDEANPTAAETQEAIMKGLVELTSQTVIDMPPEAVMVEWVAFHGSLADSMSQFQVARDMLYIQTGAPGLIERREMPMSGSALRQQHMKFYSTGIAIQNNLRPVLEEAASFALGTEVEVEWEHAWDVSAMSAVPDENPAASAENDPDGGGEWPIDLLVR